MNLFEISRDCYEIEKANGFDPSSYTNIPSKAMFVITELVEAADAARSGNYGLVRGKDSLEEELADSAIRLLAMLYGCREMQWQDRRYTMSKSASIFSFDMINTAYSIISFLSRAVELWRHDKAEDCIIALECALADIFKFSQVLTPIENFSLIEEIIRKCEINRKRGLRHGKVQSQG